jgi:CRP/FNR family transcriptional regulator, anaerobic regulatory protein
MNLLTKLQEIQPISEATALLLQAKFKTISYKKKEIILQEGTLDQKVRFINKGLMKISHEAISLKNNPRDVISWFLKEGDIASHLISFFEQKPADETITAIEDCTCEYIATKDLFQLAEDNVEICKLIGKWSGKYLINYHYRLQIYRNNTAEARLAYFLKTNRDLVGRLTQKDIASFLDLDRSSYNRINLREFLTVDSY